MRASGGYNKTQSTTDHQWTVSKENNRINIANSFFSPQIKREVNGLGLEVEASKTIKKKKDGFMKDLLGFRLNNPTAFSHKAFGTRRLNIPWRKESAQLLSPGRLSMNKNDQRMQLQDGT